ncbi:hypothetical protein ACP70R_021025 [Stipagrostis hirtigluma subsp. patula]
MPLARGLAELYAVAPSPPGALPPCAPARGRRRTGRAAYCARGSGGRAAADGQRQSPRVTARLGRSSSASCASSSSSTSSVSRQFRVTAGKTRGGPVAGPDAFGGALGIPLK